MRFLRITAFIIVILAAGTAGVVLALLRGDTIYPGVRAAGVDLGGLTKAQAETTLAVTAADKAREHITLRCAGHTLSATLGELGWRMPTGAAVEQAYAFGREGGILQRLSVIIDARRKGVELHVYTFSKHTATRFLGASAKSINRPPTNARLILNDGVLEAVPDKPGVKLDITKSLERVVQAVDSGEHEAELAVASIPPKITIADFEGIDGVTASYSTPYNPWERDRTYNLGIACRAINGTLIKPGETFSYNKTVGPRLKEYGFRDAKMFVDGQIEPGTGGGVCQVSTTVYNAALLANMKVLRRSHHSRPVVYAPVGRDATVAYPAIDLKFENTTAVPIYILASVGRRTVDVTLLGGKSDGRKVEIVAVGHQVIRPPVITRQAADSEPGKAAVNESGRPGHQVSIYRIVKQGGRIVKQEIISKDYYRPESRVIIIPSPKPQSQSEP